MSNSDRRVASVCPHLRWHFTFTTRWQLQVQLQVALPRTERCTMPDAPAGSTNGNGAPASGGPSMRVGNLTVNCINDDAFGRLRTALGYNAWLSDALAAFDWDAMAAGGGKGGNKMARTPCKRLFVKEVSGGDLSTLCDPAFLEVRNLQPHLGLSCILRACTCRLSKLRACLHGCNLSLLVSNYLLPHATPQAYVARVSTGSSLIVHLLVHFTRPDGQTCVVMNNWLPVRLATRWSVLPVPCRAHLATHLAVGPR